MEHPLHLLVQLEQDETGGKPTGGHADATSDIGRRETSVEQSLVRLRLLDRRQVLALEVLDEHDLLLFQGAEITHDHRYLNQSGQTCRSQSAVAGDDDVVGRDEERLQDALDTDRADQVRERIRFDSPTWVEWVRT
jgi:hypothetical protein